MTQLLAPSSLRSAQLPWPSLRSCQWPIGQPGELGFCFCDVPLALTQRSSYCPEHHARAYLQRPKSQDSLKEL